MQNYQKASIYTLEKYFICDAKIASIKGKELELIVNNDIFAELNSDVCVTIYDDIYGLLTYRGQISEFKKVVLSAYEVHYRLKCVLVSMMEILQRRSNVKVKVNIQTSLILVDSLGNKLLDSTTKEMISYPIIIKDISASGLLFQSKNKLEIGQKFHFQFDKTKKPIDITAEILRVGEQEKEYKSYGCKFLNVSEYKESIIRQFVFKMQILEKKKNRALIWMQPDEDE